MKRPEIIRKPLASAHCTQKGCKGIMMVFPISRLELGLGHEAHECDRCGRKVKFVPAQN